MKNGLILVAIIFLWSCGETEKASGNSAKPQDMSVTMHGKELFDKRCAACHYVNKEMTGPALRGSRQRWPDSTKLYAFIRNSDSMIRVDPYAEALWKAWNQTAMNPNPDLNDHDIYSILEYIESRSVE